MELKIYSGEPPKVAIDVRVTVFVDEQGFCDEFDEIDATAVHFVLLDGERAIANCRVFKKEDPDAYFLGRLAVLKEYRGRHLGERIVSAAEESVRSWGGRSITLHSQAAAEGFYAKLGYKAFGEPDDEQGCPHVWMKKEL